jgi:hypothetical protein
VKITNIHLPLKSGDEKVAKYIGSKPKSKETLDTY